MKIYVKSPGPKPWHDSDTDTETRGRLETDCGASVVAALPRTTIKPDDAERCAACKAGVTLPKRPRG